MAKEKQLSALDKQIMVAMGDGREVGLDTDPAREAWPNLWEWLTRIYVGRDRLKQPANLSISLIPSGVNVRLVDRDLSVSIEVTVPHLADAFQAIEQNLISENPAIRNWGKREPNLRKRKKQD